MGQFKKYNFRSTMPSRPWNVSYVESNLQILFFDTNYLPYPKSLAMPMNKELCMCPGISYVPRSENLEEFHKLCNSQLH